MGKNVKIDTSGLDKLKRNLEEVEGKHSLQLIELFPEDFMTENTSFTDIELFFNKFGVFDEMDFNEIDESKLDEFVKANSRFQDWNEMKNDAAALMIKKKLGLD